MIKGLKELYYYHQNLIEHSGISKDGLLICDEKNTFYKSHENLFTRLVAHRQDHLLMHMEELNPF